MLCAVIIVRTCTMTAIRPTAQTAGTKVSRYTEARALCITLAVLLHTAGAGAAHLGFTGPREFVRPGETFRVNIVAVFEPNEPAQWDTGARPQLSLTVLWPECFRALTCTWNTTAWQFSNAGWRQDDSEGMAWARGAARTAAALTGAIVIATVECLAVSADEDAFFYDTTGDPYETQLTVRQGGEVVDILGDPDDDDDGLDELLILVADTPGYILSVQPQRPAIPLTLTPAAVPITIRRAGPAAPYDHVRIYLQYDPYVFECVDPVALRRSMPAYFTNVLIRCAAQHAAVDTLPATEIITNAFEGDLFIEAWCAPTNAEGVVCTAHFAPLDIEEASELLLAFDEPGAATAVTRLGVDVLGKVSEEDDGVEHAWLSVRYVDGLRLALVPEQPVLIAGRAAAARLVLRKSIPDAVAVEQVQLTLLFDSNLLAGTALAFMPAAHINTGVWATLDVTNALLAINGATHTRPWTNATCLLDLTWTNGALVMTENEVCLGVLQFVPQQAGMVGFLLDDGSVMVGLAELVDKDWQAAEWPMTVSVAVDPHDARCVLVTPASSVSQGLYPGDTWDVRIMAHGATFTNAVYDLYWAYDAELVRVAGVSPGVSALELAGNGVTAHAVRVSGMTTTSATTELGRVTLRARRPGLVALTPLMPGSPYPVSCGMTAEGRDVLGAPSITDDGVAAYYETLKRPERVNISLTPRATLHLGGDSQLALRLDNPAHMAWDELRVSVLFAPEGFIISTSQWRTLVPGAVMENRIELATTVVNGATSAWYRAVLHLQCPASTSALDVATLPVTIIDGEPFWLFETDNANQLSATRAAYDGLELTVPDYLNIINGEAWVVYPNALSIWLSDVVEPPVLGSNYTLTVRLNNPHGVCVDRVTFCWYFDALQLEAGTPVVLPGITTNGGGFVTANNFNADESYVIGDVRLAAPTTNADIPIARFTIRPKLNQVLEITPGAIDLDDETELHMGAWHPAGFNAIELEEIFPEDACPVWRRGVVWVDVPQLVFEDIELDPYEAVILSYEDIFLNGDSGQTYLWHIAGTQDHVAVTVMPQTRTIVVRSLDAWEGEVRFVIYCQRVGSPYVGWATLRVMVGDTEPDTRLALEMPRTDFLADNGNVFRRAAFTILNARTQVWVTARLQDAKRVWHTVQVCDDLTGTSGTAVLMQTRGRVVVNTSSLALGRYTGRVEARYGAPTNPPQAVASFRLEIFRPGLDSDGDAYYVEYRGAAGRRAFTERVIDITGGADDDCLVMHVIRGPRGDGFVALESITSDRGFKQISLRGDCGVIDVNGPLGTVRVDGGMLGEVLVWRGGLKALIVQNKWGGKDDEFLAEAGILKGVMVQNEIGMISVFGGSIGVSDEPAVIIAHYGSIGSVQTKAMVKKYADDGWSTTVVAGDDGANIFASINAPRGTIGRVVAAGGVIGSPDDDPLCTIRAPGAIGRVAARAVNCEGEAIGGSIFADIRAGGPVQSITAMGGDITRSEILWPEDIGDADILPVTITAPSIGTISVSGKAYAYDGTRDGFGGNLRAAITVSNTIGSIAVKGGNACMQVFTESRLSAIGHVSVRPIGYKEWNDDTERTWRGGDVISSIIATTSAAKYRSPNPADYHGTIGGLNVAGAIVNSWIALKGPDRTDAFAYDRFSYTRLVRSEIWEAKASRIYIRADYTGAR